MREKSNQDTLKRLSDFHNNQMRGLEEDIQGIRKSLDDKSRDIEKWKNKFIESDNRFN